jgi:hypothetical protein
VTSWGSGRPVLADGKEVRACFIFGERKQAMLRGMGVVVAGALLFTAGGCLLDSTSLGTPNGPHKDQTISGSLEYVKVQVEKTLQIYCVPFKFFQEGDSFRFTGPSFNHDNFVLVLTRMKVERGEPERTIMHMEWQKSADEPFWDKLVNAVANSAQTSMPGDQPGVGQMPYGPQGQQPGMGQMPYGLPGQQPGMGQMPYGQQGQQPGMGQMPYGQQGLRPGMGQMPYGQQGQPGPGYGPQN